MFNNILNTLPASCLVPFEVPKLAEPHVIWKNQAIADGLDFGEYSYCAPHDGDPENIHLQETKVFFGERYGGRGTGSNGGGVRCGFDGKVQVKGIGRNCLVGNSNDFWHMHGGANLEEAIREAVWGEICNEVLPFGGIRVYGIIATGTNSYFEGDATRMLPRVLILREATLRPAHFMRAINFDPIDEMRRHPISDADRTKAAVNEIDLGLAAVLGRQPTRRLDPDFINEGLIEMARRFAAQMTAARARRMPHGAINCSNISLDGRYLDYETISTISDYGRVITARGNPDLWKQQTALHSTFLNLLFYVRNYLPPEVGQKIISAEKLTRMFNTCFEQRLMIEFIKLTGIPEKSLLKLDGGLLNNMWFCISQIIARGNKEPFKLPQMPEKMGAFHLNSIFRTACLCSSEAQIKQEIAPLLEDETLRNMFAFCFTQIRKAYLCHLTSNEKQSASLFVALNCIRLNTTFMDLCHPVLEASIVGKIEGSEGTDWVPGFISTLTVKATALLREPAKCGLEMPWFQGEEISIREDGISAPKYKNLNRQKLIGMLDETLFTDRQKRMLTDLCH